MLAPWLLAASPDAQLRPLDLHRMFLGDEPPLYLVEIALRTVILFSYTVLMMRLLGKRGVAQLSLLEVTIILGLGSVVGDPMFQQNIPLSHALVVITLIVLLYRLLMRFVRKSPRFERFIEGRVTCLVEDGRMNLDALEEERLSAEKLFEILRLSGVTHLGQVKCAYMEQSGELSAFLFPPRQTRAGLAITPPWDIHRPALIGATGDAVPPGRYACRRCGACQDRHEQAPLGPCERCHQLQWTLARESPLGPDVQGASPSG